MRKCPKHMSHINMKIFYGLPPCERGKPDRGEYKPPGSTHPKGECPVWPILPPPYGVVKQVTTRLWGQLTHHNQRIRHICSAQINHPQNDPHNSNRPGRDKCHKYSKMIWRINEGQFHSRRLITPIQGNQQFSPGTCSSSCDKRKSYSGIVRFIYRQV